MRQPDVERHRTPAGRTWVYQWASRSPRGALVARVHVAGLGAVTVSVPVLIAQPEAIEDAISACVDAVRPPPPRTAV